jgi:thiol-disulfide isomerase/thioredoxin
MRLILLLVAVLLSACSRPDYIDIEGNSGQFKDFHGQWLVINYWAIWCKPCRLEIPELNELAAITDDDIAVLGVNYDQNSLEQLKIQAAEMGVEFATLTEDPANILGYSTPRQLPTTIIINPQGLFEKALPGLQTKHSLLAALAKNTN